MLKGLVIIIIIFYLFFIMMINTTTIILFIIIYLFLIDIMNAEAGYLITTVALMDYYYCLNHLSLV